MNDWKLLELSLHSGYVSIGRGGVDVIIRGRVHAGWKRDEYCEAGRTVEYVSLVVF